MQPVEKAGAQDKVFASGPTLNRIIWRWHFWAGLIAAPVLIVMSITGAIYIFKPDIEPLLHPELYNHESAAPACTLQEQLDSAVAYAGNGWHVSVVEISEKHPDTTAFFLSDEENNHKRLRVSVHGAECLGEVPRTGFFPTVLSIHRRMMAGTIGRVLVELTTSWCLILVTSGIVLWWPGRFKRVWRALVPRFRSKKRYVVVRDSHVMPGTWIMPIAFVIALTGLLYSVLWGTSFLLIGFSSGSFDIVVNPPLSTTQPPEGVGQISVDTVMELAEAHEMPLSRISIELPHDDRAAFAFKSGGEYGASVSQVLFIDQYSGNVIEQKRLSQLPVMAQWTQWNYPLHVGSVLGWVSKILWLIACVILCVLPVTGVWMWLLRRRRGTSGFPRRYSVPLPRWMLALVVLTGAMLPVAGLSLLIVALIDWLIARRNNSNRKGVPQPA
ncbi:MAG: PepSY domain-containing protein [Planctomycetota bacterium]